MRNAGNKYNARKASLDGHTFDSQAELARYLELRLMQQAGRIDELSVRPVYVLLPTFEYQGKRERGVSYEADFSYLEIDEDGISTVRVIEDVKGGKATQTDAFKIKAKFLKAQIAQAHGQVEFRVLYSR